MDIVFFNSFYDSVFNRVKNKKTNNNWKIQCKLPPKTKRFCPLVLK